MNMRNEWDERADKNAFHYVSSFREDWDDESFYRWGEIQTQSVIDNFLKSENADPANMIALEIGCGAGRMSRALASRFKYVYSFDVSSKYVGLAREKNGHLKNVTFRVNDGLSFPEIKDSSIDFAFCGWTMQHMPTKDVVIKNIHEIARTLKPGGLYKINPVVKPKELSKRLMIRVSRLVPGLVAAVAHKDRLKLTSTYTGTLFDECEITKVLSGVGLSVRTVVEEDGSQLFYGKRVMEKWFCGKKSSLR